MSRYPTEGDCLSILESEGCSRRVIRHSCTVMLLAERIAGLCGADVALVRAGALLHDVGRSATHSLRHGIEGSAIVREHGLPEELASIVERHIGSGITTTEAVALGLPEGDYIPRTLEETIVAHADNLVSDRRYRRLEDCLQNMRSKGLNDQAIRAHLMHDRLSEMAGVDLDELSMRMDPKGHEGPCRKYLA